MLWGCIAYSGVGILVFIDNNIDKCIYTSKAILQNNLKRSAEKLSLENYNYGYFQQYEDAKHIVQID